MKEEILPNGKKVIKTDNMGKVGTHGQCFCSYEDKKVDDTAVTQFTAHDGSFVVGISHCRSCGVITDFQLHAYNSGYDQETRIITKESDDQ